MSEEPKKKPSLLERDVRWVIKHAAAIGFFLALVCHFIPPHYRVICDKIAHLCTGGS